MKLKKIVTIEGKIICKTGLHIGGMNNQIKIGGIDNEIVKHPLTNEPYIPGSSLKGKMRSQLEKSLGKIKDSGDPCGCGQKSCPVCVIFGAHRNPNAESAPTRIIVRDSSFTDETTNKYNSILKEKGIGYLEEKAENIIDRKKGIAGSPRFFERVPAGAEFKLNISIQIFDDDKEDWIIKNVEDALYLVQESYLGGSGSRGYGQVEFDYEII